VAGGDRLGGESGGVGIHFTLINTERGEVIIDYDTRRLFIDSAIIQFLILSTPLPLDCRNCPISRRHFKKCIHCHWIPRRHGIQPTRTPNTYVLIFREEGGQLDKGPQFIAKRNIILHTHTRIINHRHPRRRWYGISSRVVLEKSYATASYNRE